jgi:hypothetical protein
MQAKLAFFAIALAAMLATAAIAQMDAGAMVVPADAVSSLLGALGRQG